MFLREYVPHSLRDAWRVEFEQLHQGSMAVSEYAVYFSRLARHAMALVAKVRERVRRFIEGLHPSICTTLLAVSGVPSPHRPQEPYYAPLVSSMPPTRSGFTGQSSRPILSQSQSPHPPRGCFECGNTRHMVRDFPKAKRGAPPQTYQPPRAPPGPSALLPAQAATPPPQPARGGGWGGRGRPRGGGQSRYYSLPSRSEAVASDSVITGIVPIYHRNA
ncbi:uncharacterized protein [Nicotiana tomentosiformis]|uniref:uncharacterized protein n=1 Tax=Nicotiana tomentosiformis TaxID=4098 RepID=UPI00388C3C57